MVKTHIDVPNKQVYFEKISELVNYFALTKGFGIVFCVSNNFFFRQEVNHQTQDRLTEKGVRIIDFLLEEEKITLFITNSKKENQSIRMQKVLSLIILIFY